MVVTIDQIQQVFVDELKKIAARENQKKMNPKSDDIIASLVPPKDIDVDYDYLKEMVTNLFNSNIFIYPKNQKELEECVQSLVLNLIYDPYFYDNKISIRRGRFSKSPLVTLNQSLIEGKNEPLLTYTVKFNLQDFVFNKISSEQIAKSGSYEITDNISASLYNVKKWLQGKSNVFITIPFARCDLNNIKNDMNQILFALKTDVAGEYKLGDVTVSFGQEKSEDWNTRYLHTEHTLRHMKDLDEIVRKFGGNLYFSEIGQNSKTKWTTNQLIAANNQIDELANTIKENKLSPFEAVLFVCAWSSIHLTYNNGCNDDELNNTIVSAAVTKKLRCVGFAEFVNAVLGSVNFNYLDLKEYPDAGILDTLKICCTTAKNEKGFCVPNHCESQIYIEDKKYDIMGDYFCDVNLANIFNSHLKQLENQMAVVGLPSVLPFNPLFLRNLTEFKTLLPDYKIFPYNENETYNVQYQLLNGKEQFIKSIDGIEYSEYLKKSDEIMDYVKNTQGKPISAQKFCDAYKRILPILYPELKKEDISIMERVISQFNKLIDSVFFNESSEKNSSLKTSTKKDKTKA